MGRVPHPGDPPKGRGGHEVALGEGLVALWGPRQHHGVVAPWGRGGTWVTEGDTGEDVEAPGGGGTLGTPWGPGGTASGHAVGLLLGSLRRTEQGQVRRGHGCPQTPPGTPMSPPWCHPPDLGDADACQGLDGGGQAGDDVQDLAREPRHPDVPGATGHQRHPARPQQRLRHRLRHLAQKGRVSAQNLPVAPRSLPTNLAVPNPARFGPIIRVGRPPNALKPGGFWRLAQIPLVSPQNSLRQCLVPPWPLTN